MELPEKMAAFGAAYHMLPEGGHILAAVSGGADSICLLAALLELSGQMGFSVTAAHFNHMLRGDESDRDEKFVRRFCGERGVALQVAAGDVRLTAGRQAAGIEEAARSMRYDFLNEAADRIGAVRIATAHTADDNTETVLLNLARGAGLNGLSGIPPIRGRIIRPMLTATRREVMEYLSSRGLSFVEDSTNSLDICSRNLIRHRVIPVLREINPRFAENTASASSLLREDEEYLGGLAREFIAAQGCDNALDARELAALPRPVSARVVRQMAGESLPARRVSDILSLCASENPSARLCLGRLTVRREYDRLVFTEDEPLRGFKPVKLGDGDTAEIPELHLSVTCARTVCGPECSEKINNSFNTFLFKYDNVCGKIVIRPRETGDKIALPGGNGSKSLKKLFIEKKIPAHRRCLIPVVTDEAGPLSVLGIGSGVRAACLPGDDAVAIQFKEIP